MFAEADSLLGLTHMSCVPWPGGRRKCRQKRNHLSQPEVEWQRLRNEVKKVQEEKQKQKQKQKQRQEQKQI